MQLSIRAFPLLILAGWLTLGPAQAQTSAATSNPAPASASTNAAPATTPSSGGTNAAPAAPPPVVALANVVTDAMTDSGQLQDIQAGLAADQTSSGADEDLPELRDEIDQHVAQDNALLASHPSLGALRSARLSWHALSDSLDASKDALSRRIAALDATIAQLGQMKAKWDATLTAARASSAPSDVLSRISAVIAAVGQTTQAASDARGKILSSQNRLAEQEARVVEARGRLRRAQESATSLLFSRDSEPIWDLAGSAKSAGPSTGANPYSFAAEWPPLVAYIAQKEQTLFAQVAIYVALAVFLLWVRNALREGVTDDPARKRAIEVFESPLAIAAVITFILSGWLYPLAPRPFLAAIGAMALVPAVLILRRLIEPALFPALYAMVVSYFVDQLRYIIADAPTPARLLFLVQLLAACGFLVWMLASRRLCGMQTPGHLPRILRIYARLALAILAAAVVADVLGYARLSSVMGGGMLESSYLAVVFYAAVRIAEGLIAGALTMRPISLLGMVRRHARLLARKASWIVRAFGFVIWAREALELFMVATPLWNGAVAILDYTVNFGPVALSLGPLLRFALTIWAALLLSRFLRFFLAEEIFPNLKLGRGVPYAASTMVHYLVLIVGVFVALAAMGIDLGKYSILAGALGVGLGFGLQNITNNFVSGIILLFERPIKVGDVIQMDANLGTVQSIGIRASVIRISNGSEVIMPNGNLISNQVTNWTFSNRQRLIEVPVIVSPQAHPDRVIALMIETAQAHPLVLKDPPPQVLLNTQTSNGLSFELRAWTSNHEVWRTTRSELALAVFAALRRENIALGTA